MSFKSHLMSVKWNQKHIRRFRFQQQKSVYLWFSNVGSIHLLRYNSKKWLKTISKSDFRREKKIIIKRHEWDVKIVYASRYVIVTHHHVVIHNIIFR